MTAIGNLLILVASFYLFVSVVSGSDESYDGPWRKAVEGDDTCWTFPDCNRAMITSHGGDWDLQHPYDSLPAFQRAYAMGADAVKGDFRVSSDNVGVVMHSSPVEAFESFNCYGKYVEQMTAEECQQCRMLNSNYTFITVPTMLNWAEGLVNVMLCVKRSEDFPRAISTLIELNATKRAFLEIHLSDLFNLQATNVPGWDKVFYVVELSGPDELSKLLSADSVLQGRALLAAMYDLENWPNVEDDIARSKSTGLRTFSKSRDNGFTATVANHLKLFQMGIDVAYTYNLTNAITARIDVNTKRGIQPAR